MEWEAFPDAIILLMSADHFLCLSSGSDKSKLLVLIIQLNTILISSKVPSAFSFFAETKERNCEIN
jgi:hypothetical protein